jgi:membrane protein
MRQLKKWIGYVADVPWIRFIVSIFRRFANDNGPFYAAGLAFFMLLSLVPILLSAVAILSCFVNAHVASHKVTAIIQSLLPAGGAREEAAKFITTRVHLYDQVKNLVDHRGAAGIIGFLSLIWATMQIFINASVAMNAMWEVKESRNWFVVRGIALLLMIATGSFSVISLVMSSLPSAIIAFRLPIIHRLPIPLAALTLVSEVIAVAINAATYTIIYKILPNSKISWKDAIFGGLTASVLFEVAKKLMASYLLRANHSVYGDLANLILFILWIYYSMIILLLGAEVTVSFSKPPMASRLLVRKRI